MPQEGQPQTRQFRGPTIPGRKGPGPIVMFRLTAGNAVAEVAPSRGGIVTRFAVGDEEVLYLEPLTLADKKEKVRGGIPVLYPIAGRLTGDRYQVNGRSYPMRQHGLARQAPWSVANIEGGHMTLEFRSDAVTRTSFPFEFSYRLTVDIDRAGHRSLALESEISNLGKEPMPLHTGFHPYFFVPDRDKGEVFVECAAATAYDNIRGDTAAWEGEVDLTAAEVDLHLRDLVTDRAILHLPGRLPRVLQFQGFYSSVVLWTLAGKDFVCVEPWSAPGDALNTGKGLLTVEPGETKKGTFIISI